MNRQTETQPSDFVKKPFVVKVYLVYLPLHTAKNGAPNRKIVSAKLTWSAAKHVKDQIPGAEIERVYVDKEFVTVSGNLDNIIKTLKGEI